MAIYSTGQLCFLLISRELIYMFLSLSITIAFYILFGSTSLIRVLFCHLRWLQPLGFSPHSINPYCSFAIRRVFMLLLTWMISWSLLTLSMLGRELKLLCVLHWFILDYMLIFSCLNSVSCSNIHSWDYAGIKWNISVSIV